MEQMYYLHCLLSVILKDMKVRIILKNTKVLKRGMCVGIRSVIVLKGFDEMVYMKVILTSYMYIEFDNTVYFFEDYVRRTFFEYKDIGGNISERYVLQEIYCNSNSDYTIL